MLECVTASDEAALLAEIDSAECRSDLRRRVQHYGWRYDYKARRVDTDMRLGPLPDWADGLAARLAAEGLFASKPDQVIDQGP